MAKVYDNQKGAKDEWAKLKDAPLKTKLEYLAEYYIYYAIAFVAVVIFLATFVPSCIDNRRPIVISGEFMETGPTEEGIETLHTYLCDKFDLDIKKNNISLTERAIDTRDTTQVTTMHELVLARIVAEDVDFYFGSEDFLSSYMDLNEKDGSCFADITEFLPADIVSALEAQDRLTFFTMSDGTSYPYMIDTSGSKLNSMLGLDNFCGKMVLVVNSPHLDSLIEVCRLIVEEP